MTIDSIHATGHHEEFDGEHGPALLAAHLRGAAIELLHRRETDREWLVTLLEAAATVILDQREKLREVPSSPGARRLAEIKEQHRRAYERWTTEDDASLRQQYAEGHSVTELAKRSRGSRARSDRGCESWALKCLMTQPSSCRHPKPKGIDQFEGGEENFHHPFCLSAALPLGFCAHPLVLYPAPCQHPVEFGDNPRRPYPYKQPLLGELL